MLAALHSSERELCLQGLVPGRACAIHMRPLGVMVSTRLFGPLPALFLGPVLMVACLAPRLLLCSPAALLWVLPSLGINRAHAPGILFPLSEIVISHGAPSFT